jgi:hypothetical protein
MSKRKEFWCKSQYIQKPESMVHLSAGEQSKWQSNSQIVNQYQFRGNRLTNFEIAKNLHAEQ